MTKPPTLDSTWVKFNTTAVLADPITSLPITVICNYDSNDTLLYTEAYNADGSTYTGNISTLVFPNFFLGTTPIPIKDTAGNPLTSTGGSLNVNITGGGGGVVGIVDQGTGGASPWLINGIVSVSNLPAIQPVSGTFWQAVQPVSGTFWQAVQPVSLGSVPLPTGAATYAAQTDKSQYTRITDGTDTAEVQPGATYDIGNDPALEGLTVNARLQQIWSNSYADNSGEGADGFVYAQNQDAHGNVGQNLSSIRGKLIRFRNASNDVRTGSTAPPLPIGGYGYATVPTVVTAGRPVDAYWDLSGRLCTFMDLALPAGTNSIGQVTANAGTNLNTSLLATEATLLTVASQQVDGNQVTSVWDVNTGNILGINSSGEISIAELTAAATLSDTKANPSTTVIGAMNMNYNGSTWTRQLQAANALNSTGTGIANIANTAQFDDTSSTTITENQFGHLRMSSNRNLYSTVRDAAGNERGLNISSNNAASVAGDIANAASDSGNPVKVGGLAKTSNPTAVTDGQRVNALHDKLGKQVVVQSIRDLKTKNFITLTSTTTETTLLSAGGAGVFLDISSITFTNTSATVCEVELRDATAGSAVHSFEVPPTDSRGITISDPIIQTTANNNWTAKCLTSVASMKIQVNAVKNI